VNNAEFRVVPDLTHFPLEESMEVVGEGCLLQCVTFTHAENLLKHEHLVHREVQLRSAYV
jgi:hypothetical protein